MSSPITEQSLAEYVREKLLLHSGEERPPLAEETLWYAGGVLVRFVETRRLFADGHEGRVPVLAQMYGEAYAASTISERVSWLRQLGDTALFLGALFPDNFHRRGIGKDYFVGMGGGAYSSLAGEVPAQRNLFRELSACFPRLMCLLSNVCEQELVFDARDIVAMYERWAETGNPDLRLQLNSLGIVPIEGGTTRN
ncbi:MAG: hypothetical protein AAGA91_07610 [Pseudomonadota bacterium]